MCRTEIESILVEKVYEDHPYRRRHIYMESPPSLVASRPPQYIQPIYSVNMVQPFTYCYSTSYLSSILFTISTQIAFLIALGTPERTHTDHFISLLPKGKLFLEKNYDYLNLSRCHIYEIYLKKGTISFYDLNYQLNRICMFFKFFTNGPIQIYFYAEG